MLLLSYRVLDCADGCRWEIISEGGIIASGTELGHMAAVIAVMLEAMRILGASGAAPKDHTLSRH